MGIRVVCPNGHILNVKSELAGCVGRCPKCNERVHIPKLDEAIMVRSRKSGPDSGGGPTDSPSASQSVVLPVVETVVSPKKKEQNRKRNPKKRKKTQENEKILQENFRILNETYSADSNNKLTPGKGRGGHSPDLSMANPLSDPSAVWYIQVPDGPQFGPTTGVVLQSWIQEKRVSPEMLVWKQGWSNWTTAREVFPELEKLFPNFFSTLRTPDAPSPQTANASGTTNEPGKLSDVSLSPQLKQKITKKKKMSRNHLFFLILSGLIIVLAAVLWQLLAR